MHTFHIIAFEAGFGDIIMPVPNFEAPNSEAFVLCFREPYVNCPE